MQWYFHLRILWEKASGQQVMPCLPWESLWLRPLVWDWSFPYCLESSWIWESSESHWLCVWTGRSVEWSSGSVSARANGKPIGWSVNDRNRTINKTKKINIKNIGDYFKILSGKNQGKKMIREIALFHFPIFSYLKYRY